MVKSAVTLGAITGFGAATVKVNGIQFQSVGATVSIDGKSAQPADLHAGEVCRSRVTTTMRPMRTWPTRSISGETSSAP